MLTSNLKRTSGCHVFQTNSMLIRYLCYSKHGKCYGVWVISKFMNEPRKSYMMDIKRIMRYVKTKLGFCPLFHAQGSEKQPELICYILRFRLMWGKKGWKKHLYLFQFHWALISCALKNEIVKSTSHWSRWLITQ